MPIATSWPGRFHASLRALASPPGRLTSDWLRGRRVPYVSPLTLFLWVNVAFFIVQSASGLGVLSWPLRVHLEQGDVGPLAAKLLAMHFPGNSLPASYAAIFDPLEAVHAKSLVILMTPAFAGVLRLLLADRKIGFAACNVFALHLYAFTLIWLCALFPTAAVGLRLFAWAGGHATLDAVDGVISALEAIGIGWYLAAALSKVWGLPRLRCIGSAALLVIAMGLLLRPYHFAVFAATVFAT